MACRCLECELERENIGDPWLKDLTEEDFMTVSEKDAKDRQLIVQEYENYLDELETTVYDDGKRFDPDYIDYFTEGFIRGMKHPDISKLIEDYENMVDDGAFDHPHLIYFMAVEIDMLRKQMKDLQEERDDLLAEREQMVTYEPVGYAHPLDIEKIRTHSYSQVSLRNCQDDSHSVRLVYAKPVPQDQSTN